MRSRYTAYTIEEIDYIVDSHDPSVTGDVDRDATLEWAQKSEWLGLEIVDVEAGGKDDAEGTVEFIARYRVQGAEASHHERSRFRRAEGRWVYLDGEMVKPKPMVREEPKVGRNSPCPCGSGQKFKKCCGAN